MKNINNIEDFKVELEKKCKIPVRFQKFIYKGRLLNDILIFSHGDTIFCDTIKFQL